MFARMRQGLERPGWNYKVHLRGLHSAREGGLGNSRQGIHPRGL